MIDGSYDNNPEATSTYAANGVRRFDAISIDVLFPKVLSSLPNTVLLKCSGTALK